MGAVDVAAPPLLVLAGATATGKTGLSIAVATRLRTDGVPVEIISADSRQVFRGMDIGTAKASVGERAGIPHHGLDLVDPDAAFSVVDFVRHVRGVLPGIAARGGVAILAGGTGLYLRAVARGLDAEALPFDAEVRAGIEAGLQHDGLEPAVARLQAIAPRLASRIDLANPRRVARALEIAELRGDTLPPPPTGYGGPVSWLGLRLAPAVHREWIARRAREQFDAGLIEEAGDLRERFDPSLPAFSAIGYREAWAVIDGTLTREAAIELDAQRNVAFAKRQATWFRSEPNVEWHDATSAPLNRAVEVAPLDGEGRMSPMRAPAEPAVRLPVAKVHAWRIERQLLGRGRGATPDDVARTLVGVQAQVASSAALAIALRSKPSRGARPLINATTRALRERRLVRSWAMRGTLHLFAAEDVSTVAAALGGKGNWRRPAWLRWFGVTEPEMDRLIDAIGEILDDGTPRTRAELAEMVGARLGPHAGKLLLGSWGSALKVASDRHYLVQSSEDDAGVRFVRASRWISGWREQDPETALATLVERYLAAYGPATLKELLRWWGVAQLSVMRPVIAALGDALTEVDVDGSRAYVRTVDLDAIESTRPTRGAVHLVGGFDPLIVGAGLRAQLLPAAHLKRVSRTAGWISPVVLVDGVAAGVWDATRSGDRLSITVDAFEAFSPSQRGAIGRAADRVATVQGARAEVAYGRVFERQAGAAPSFTIRPEDA